MTIRLSENFRALFYAPFYAAEAMGAFTEAGVEVVLRPSTDPAAAQRALMSRQVDVMWGGPLRVLNAHHSDPASSLVCFCDVVARDPFFIIGRTPKPNFTLGDLAGLTFATVSEVPTPWICLQDDLRRAGIDPAKLSRITDKTMAENEAALREGKADAVQLFQPFAERLIHSGAGHLWYAAADRGLTAYTTLVTRRDVLNERKDDLLRVTRALTRALGWSATVPALEIAHLLAAYFPHVPSELFAQCIDRYRGVKLWAIDPVIRREGFDRLHAAMRSGGMLQRDVAFEACVDTTLAESVLSGILSPANEPGKT
jgi:NitT/TauT family transport system substrate-binding protein